jgi:hypothetical protein
MENQHWTNEWVQNDTTKFKPIKTLAIKALQIKRLFPLG